MNLKERQDAGETVRGKMLAFLMQYTPARDLTVGNVQTIAEAARAIAFDAFSNGGGDDETKV